MWCKGAHLVFRVGGLSAGYRYTTDQYPRLTRRLHRSKRLDEGSHGPSGPLRFKEASTQAVWTPRLRPSGGFPPPRLAHPPRWLRPRRHAEPEHLAPRPAVIRQARGPGGCPPLPALGRAGARRRLSLEQRVASARVREAKMIRHVLPGQLLADAVLARAPRGDPPSHRRPLRTDGQGEARDAGRVERPARGRQPLLACPEGPEDEAGLHSDQTLAPPALAHRRLEPRRPWIPRGGGAGPVAGRRGGWTHGPGASGTRWPAASGRQPPGDTAWRPPLHDLMAHAWRQGHGALADLDRPQRWGAWIARSPAPVG